MNTVKWCMWCAAAVLFAASAAAQPTGIIVNGEDLGVQTALRYGIHVPPGRYWYDKVSGLWGVEGGPYQGQISAGLPLGGVLRRDASRSHTGVIINGREIHVSELGELIQLYGHVPAGRYWLNEHLVGGSEGGPASFDLNAAAAQQAPAPPASKRYFEDDVADFCARHGC